MEVADGLGMMNFRDTAAGRRKYVEYLDERMRQEKAEKLGLAEIDGQTLHSTLRRGWYWGSQEFREKILDRFGAAIGGKTKTNRTLRSSAAAKDNSIRRAEEILVEERNISDWTMTLNSAIRSGAITEFWRWRGRCGRGRWGVAGVDRRTVWIEIGSECGSADSRVCCDGGQRTACEDPEMAEEMNR